MVKGKQWFAGGPSQRGCISSSISCVLTQLAEGIEQWGSVLEFKTVVVVLGKRLEVAERLCVTYLGEEGVVDVW